MLPDNSVGVPDAALLTSAAQQIRQQHDVALAAERACLEVARRRRAVGDLETAVRNEVLAAQLRAAAPLLTRADDLEAEARALRSHR
jgi:hypothetical protein